MRVTSISSTSPSSPRWTLSPALQTKGLHYRGLALKALTTPFEVDIYFGGFANGPLDGETDDAFFHRVIALAHRDAIEETVLRKLDAVDQVGWSVAIWALLASRSKVERSALTALQSVMRRLDPLYRDGCERLVNALVAARHLRQPAAALSFSHPSVAAGFGSFVSAEPARAAAMLEALLSALVQLDDRWLDWGLETAARVIVMVKAEDGLGENVSIPRDVQYGVDAWLDATLMSAPADFAAVLELASDAGSSGSIPSELARWFLKGTQRGGQIFNDRWRPPVFNDAWYDRVAADPRSAAIAARFVREVLPEERDSYGRSFPTRLARIVPGLAPAFADAALRLVNGGFDNNVQTIALGAAQDVAGFAPVIDAALDELARLHRRYEEVERPHWRRIQNGEFDRAEEEHFSRNHEDDGWSAGVMIEIYVERLRDEQGWGAVARHPRASELTRGWSRAVRQAPRKASIAEVRALVS